MPPTPQKSTGRSRGKSGEGKSSKPNGRKLMDELLTEVRKAYKGRTVEFRPGDLNAKGERLLRLDGDTIAYVSVLENGDLRALRSKYGLSAKGNVRDVSKAIVAKVKSGAVTGKTSGATTQRRTPAAASGQTTRQRQAAARAQAKKEGGKTPDQHTKTPGAPTREPNDKPKPTGNGERKTNGPRNGGNSAPSGK